MSYANGKIYVDGTTTPHVGVSIYDIQQALSSNENDLGTLCRLANVRKYATFKPLPTGSAQQIGRNLTAPFGLRTIYNRVNPNDGSVSSSTHTTLSDVISALDTALRGGLSNPFLEDLLMYVKPSGGANSAYRATDFVIAERVSRSGDASVRGTNNVHGYLNNAIMQYGYYDNSGLYHGISTGIGIDSNGDILSDGDVDLDATIAEMRLSTYQALETRLGWGLAYENNLCVLDWLQAMFELSSKAPLHRGVVIWTNEGTEVNYYVAVGIIPWTGTTAQAIIGTNINWNVMEFFTTNNVITSSDFLPLRGTGQTWNALYEHDQKTDWMLIPGMLKTNRHIGNRNPYAVGAFFQLADVSPYAYPQPRFYLYLRITNLGENSSVKVFLSNVENPNSPYDFLSTTNVYTASTTGTHQIYSYDGTDGWPIAPSDYTGVSPKPFNQVFIVGSTYYLCIWGKRNASDSSESVIWKQALVATVADSLELSQNYQ